MLLLLRVNYYVLARIARTNEPKADNQICLLPISAMLHSPFKSRALAPTLQIIKLLSPQSLITLCVTKARDLQQTINCETDCVFNAPKWINHHPLYCNNHCAHSLLLLSIIRVQAKVVCLIKPTKFNKTHSFALCSAEVQWFMRKSIGCALIFARRRKLRQLWLQFARWACEQFNPKSLYNSLYDSKLIIELPKLSLLTYVLLAQSCFR